MKVYLLIHESYNYWDNSIDLKTYVFKDEKSAIAYMKILSEKLIDEALEINPNLIPNENDDGDDYIEQYEDYLYIKTGEWGHEIVHIEEQDVMEMSD